MKLGVIGVGNMATAILGGIIKNEVLRPEEIIGSNRSEAGRNKAKETLDMETYKKAMEGIYSTSVNESTLDEAPMAYKNIDEIINNVQDTVEIVANLKPIYNFKAGKN